jgi:hypothetical protein
VTEGKPLEALHMLDIALAVDPELGFAREVKRDAIGLLLEQSGGKNSLRRVSPPPRERAHRHMSRIVRQFDPLVRDEHVAPRLQCVPRMRPAILLTCLLTTPMLATTGCIVKSRAETPHEAREERREERREIRHEERHEDHPHEVIVEHD